MLRELRDSIEVPPIDPAREQALLAAFDNRTEPAPRMARWAWAAAAALTLATSSLVGIAARVEPVTPHVASPVLARPRTAFAAEAGFVLVPGAHALPPLESGEVRRVEIPISALAELGIPSPAAPTPIVTADVIIGRDGFARAVRIVQ